MIGSCDAQSTLDLVTEKLNEYDLELSDICGATTDGAPVCEAMGKKAAWIHQLCYAHCLNLAANDVIYDNTYQELQVQNDSDLSEDSDFEGFDL